MKADAAVLHGGDAGFLDGDEGEVGGGGRGKMQRGSRAQVIGHPFQPLKKIQPRQPQAADEREDGESQKNRHTFDGLEFHHAGLNKKPEQLKTALVMLKTLFFPMSLFALGGIIAGAPSIKMATAGSHREWDCRVWAKRK